MVTNILIALGALLAGGGVGYAVFRPRAKSIEASAKREAERSFKNAEKEADNLLDNARKRAQQLRDQSLAEEEKLQSRLAQMQSQFDERVQKREASLEDKIEKSEQAKERFEEAKKETEEVRAKLQERLDKENEELERVAKLTKAEAKEELMKRVEEEVSNELALTYERKVDVMRKSAEEEASNIIVQAIQRFAPEAASEGTTSVVKLDSDDLKGRIIGKEGRNINAFEMMSGVDVIIDDSPGAITLSCYDMFRRYVAKIAMENLLKDGRIHPSSIEASIKKAQSEADKLILDLGVKAAQELGVSNFPDAVLKLVGRLRFRTSYGQNVLQHSLEVAWIAEAIATQIPGADPEVCKRAGLVHDMGKAVSHEVEGGHAVIGKEILEKFGVDDRVVTAMKSHHEDFPYESIEARILQAADAISASRPGARRETLEKYLKRLKELETIANSFDGVKNAYAIQAGREVRVFVDAEKVDDLASKKLAFEMARKIEKNCDYPGEVHVTLIREKRYKDVAK